MKKAIVLFLVAFALTGCGRKHIHTWAVADCVTPVTCVECGETYGEPLGHAWRGADCIEPKTCMRCASTEGEPLGHDWREASCTEPRTCLRCASTEGEPLGHTPLEADYWTPGLCAVCGEELEEALTPDFLTYGIKAGMKAGEHYAYRTACYLDNDLRTVGDLTVLDYIIIAADETHEAKDGYEWRIATFQLLFTDENARKNGYLYSFAREDYYDILLNDDSAVRDDDGNVTFTVNNHGVDRECFCRFELICNEWQGETANVTFRVNFQVPAGYDGCVYGMRDAAVERPEGSHIFDIYDPGAFLLFRFA